jgi:hypothetical protein
VAPRAVTGSSVRAAVSSSIPGAADGERAPAAPAARASSPQPGAPHARASPRFGPRGGVGTLDGRSRHPPRRHLRLPGRPTGGSISPRRGPGAEAVGPGPAAAGPAPATDRRGPGDVRGEDRGPAAEDSRPRVGTSADAPLLDSAYKLVEYEGRPVTKLSPGKGYPPGRTQVWRLPDGSGLLPGRGEAGPPAGHPDARTGGPKRAAADPGGPTRGRQGQMCCRPGGSSRPALRIRDPEPPVCVPSPEVRALHDRTVRGLAGQTTDAAAAVTSPGAPAHR